jgi:hypothetical protein
VELINRDFEIPQNNLNYLSDEEELPVRLSNIWPRTQHLCKKYSAKCHIEGKV